MESLHANEVLDLVKLKLLEVSGCKKPRKVLMEKLKDTKLAWLHKAIHRNKGKTMTKHFPQL